MFHLLPANDGCAFARDRGAIAIIVDTLRASSTVAILLEKAREVVVIRTVEDARALATVRPDALLVGERHGLPPPGFHLGNSPVGARHLDCGGRTVIFTSTTGATRAVEVLGGFDPSPDVEGEAERNGPLVPLHPLRFPSLPSEGNFPALFMGTLVNAGAVAQAAREAAQALQRDIVIIPAGHVDDDHRAGPEDTAGATVIGLELQTLGVSAAPGTVWAFDPSPPEQVPHRAAEMVRSSPHAHLLYALGPEFTADVDFCCRLNETPIAPHSTDLIPLASGEVGVVFVA